MEQDKGKHACKAAEFHLVAQDLCAFLEDWKAETAMAFKGTQASGEDATGPEPGRPTPAVSQKISLRRAG